MKNICLTLFIMLLYFNSLALCNLSLNSNSNNLTSNNKLSNSNNKSLITSKSKSHLKSLFNTNSYFTLSTRIQKNSNNSLIKLKNTKHQLNFQLNSNIENKLKNQLKKQTLETIKMENGDNKDSEDSGKSILWEGWIKYIKLNDVTTLTKPSNFFVNNDFFSQRVLKSDTLKKDSSGMFLNIVSQFHFFAKLSKHTLNILSSRQSETSKNSDSLIIDVISYVSEEEHLRYSGGIQPLGEFKEGFCFQIFTEESNIKANATQNAKSKYAWIICVDSLKERDAIVELLIELKHKYQQEHNIDSSTTSSSADALKSSTSMSDLNSSLSSASSEELSRGTTTSPEDGRWILLQDWSQCSKKCGGGKKYQQWMCVPPKPNGKPCEGKPVLTKDCNTEPCPSYGIADHNNYSKNEVNLKPVIKSLYFSQRPQERILCKIREGDVLFDSKETVDGVEVTNSLPARLVLNNRSISIFQDDNYTKSAFNFPLDIATMFQNSGNHCCLLIKAQGKSFNVCGGFGTNCGTKSNPEFAKLWLEDFDYFKNKCNTPLKDENWAQQQNEEITAEEMSQVKLEMVNETENMINDKIEKQKEASAIANIKKSQESAVKVLKKEFDLEEMLAKEEQLKALNETKELLILKKSEEKKKDCLEAALKSKEESQKKKLQNDLLLQNVDKVKEDTLKEVEEQRESLKKRIASIRSKSERRNKQIKREINIIRSSMAQGLADADKQGNHQICINSLSNQSTIDSYCNDNKNLSIGENQDCKDPDRFCYVCCETEFGSIHLQKREECYSNCTEYMNSNNKGDWEWTSSSKPTDSSSNITVTTAR